MALAINLEPSLEQSLIIPIKQGRSIVIACPGAGKTFTLSYKIANMVDKDNVKPSEILATTFTKAAAHELKERINLIAGKNLEVKATTLHAFCFSLVLKHSYKVGFTKTPTVLTVSQRDKIVNKIASDLIGVSKIEDSKVDGLNKDTLNEWIMELDIRKMSDVKMDRTPHLADKEPREIFSQVYDQFNKLCLKNNYLDFDSILTFFLKLIKNNAEKIKKDLPKYLFVDEAQDLSAIQWMIVDELSKYAYSTEVIGDDDQSIYAWRRATPWRFRSFAKTADHSFFLSFNRRCSKKVIEFSKQVIEQIPEERRLVKELNAHRDNEGLVKQSVFPFDLSVSGKIIAQKIKKEVEEKKNKYKDYAFILRSSKEGMEENAHTSYIIQALLKECNIPYKVIGGGGAIYETSEAVFFTSLVKLLSVEDDGGSEPVVLWQSVFDEVGFSQNNIDKISEGLQKSLTAGEWAARESQMSQSNKSMAHSIFNLVKYYRQLYSVGKSPQVGQLISSRNFKDILVVMMMKQAKKNARKLVSEKKVIPSLLEDAEKKELGKLMSAFYQSFSFLEHLLLPDAVEQLSLQENRQEDESDVVTIITAHSSKGLEWKTVFIMQANNANWPSGLTVKKLPNFNENIQKEMLDEERRLFYVAATRAKDELYLLSTLTHPVSDEINQPSRFLPAPMQINVFKLFKDVKDSFKDRTGKNNPANAKTQGIDLL